MKTNRFLAADFREEALQKAGFIMPDPKGDSDFLWMIRYPSGDKPEESNRKKISKAAEKHEYESPVDLTGLGKSLNLCHF